MKYDETKSLRSALRRGRKVPPEAWFDYVEVVAEQLEDGELTSFGGHDVLLHHLVQRARDGATQVDIVAYLRELWMERCPHVAFPDEPVRPRPVAKSVRRRFKKLDPKRIQRLAARYTLLNNIDVWKRTTLQKQELANLSKQLQKYGLGIR